MLEVIGRGAVTVIDGRHLTSNAYLAQRTAPLLVSGATLHVLPAGSRFDLARRVLLTHDEQLPDAEVAESRAAENDLRLLARRSPPRASRPVRTLAAASIAPALNQSDLDGHGGSGPGLQHGLEAVEHPDPAVLDRPRRSAGSPPARSGRGGRGSNPRRPTRRSTPPCRGGSAASSASYSTCQVWTNRPGRSPSGGCISTIRPSIASRPSAMTVRKAWPATGGSTYDVAVEASGASTPTR